MAAQIRFSMSNFWNLCGLIWEECRICMSAGSPLSYLLTSTTAALGNKFSRERRIPACPNFETLRKSTDSPKISSVSIQLVLWRRCTLPIPLAQSTQSDKMKYWLWSATPPGEFRRFVRYVSTMPVTAYSGKQAVMMDIIPTTGRMRTYSLFRFRLHHRGTGHQVDLGAAGVPTEKMAFHKTRKTALCKRA